MPTDDTKGKKRANSAYPNLDPSLNPRIRHEEISDIDYLHKLDPHHKAYMNKFMGEFIGGTFEKCSAHRDIKKVKNSELCPDCDALNLHQGQELRNDCFDRNNHRESDSYTKSKSAHRLQSIDYTDDIEYNPEEDIITRIDVIRRRNRK